MSYDVQSFGEFDISRDTYIAPYPNLGLFSGSPDLPAGFYIQGFFVPGVTSNVKIKRADGTWASIVGERGIDGPTGPMGLGLPGIDADDGIDGIGFMGPIQDFSLPSNLARKNLANAFTGANSFSGNPIDLLSGQIKFPAAINASSDANTLDDYEEGSWTPFDASGGGLTFGTPVFSAYYIKIGRLVFVSADINYPVNADAGHVALVGGLPFVNIFAQSSLVSAYNNYGAVQILITQSATQFGFYNMAGTLALTNADLSNKVFRAGGVYECV